MGALRVKTILHKFVYLQISYISQFLNNYDNDSTIGLSLSQTRKGSMNLFEIKKFEIEREKKTILVLF